MNVENYKVDTKKLNVYKPAYVPKPCITQSDMNNSEKVKKYAEDLEKYEAYLKEYDEYMKKYHEEESTLLKKFRNDLAVENGLGDLPQAISDLVYAKAWEDGHSSGLYEVESHYSELAEMILNVVHIIKLDS